ncbi:hypothetical protein [Actinoplanes sp. NPDC049265]|uniref:hypothetical protein n=1 Tax=Actinoplanes sp. NPDC049265 TaxID=3363902 RepID=UPI003712AE1A
MGLFRRTRSLAEADRLFDEGVATMRGGDLRRSLSVLDQAQKIYAALGPDEAARRGEARTLWRQANAYAAIGAAPNALAAGLDAAMIWEGLLEGSGDRDIGLVREMAQGYADLAMFALPLDSEQAVAHARRAVGLSEQLVRAGHPEGAEQLGVAQHNLAVTLADHGDRAGAATAAAEAVKIRQKRAAALPHPSVADWEHANSLLLSGKLYRLTGQTRFARTALERGLVVARTLGTAGTTISLQIQVELGQLGRG